MIMDENFARRCAHRVVVDFSGQTFSNTQEAEEWLEQHIENAIRDTIHGMIKEYRRQTGDDVPYFWNLER